MHSTYINYEIAKRNFELSVRLKDQSFEQIIAPPAGGTQALAQSANAATQTTNLLNFQGRLIGSMLALTNGWQAFETARLIVYRDIGILPYDEWEAFSELFPSQYHGPIIGQAPAGGQDLPRLKKPVRRRLSAGKVVGTGVVAMLGVAGYFLSTVAGMSKPLKSFFFANPNADVVTQVVRLGDLQITVVEKGCARKLRRTRMRSATSRAARRSS